MDVINSIVSTGVNTLEDEFSSTILSELLQYKRSVNVGSSAADSTAGELSNYTTKLFGAPFQLLDSVDKRFVNENPYVGSEYLRNFLLNSPILYIQPGIPHFTGGESDEGILTNLYKDTASGAMSKLQSVLTSVAGKVFDGDNLQKRMFDIKETYHDYMKYVNYMCRSVAMYMQLTSSDGNFPNFTFTNSNDSLRRMKSEPFETMRWENYRMMKNDYVPTPKERFIQFISSNTLGSTLLNVLGINTSDDSEISEDALPGWNEAGGWNLSETFNKIMSESKETIFGIYNNIPRTVQFMVEPVAFEESITNVTKQSAIEQFTDNISKTIGSEIGFMTNSNVESGIMDELAGIIGTSTGAGLDVIEKAISPATGGFIGSLYHGAINSVNGQKMIYPDIYESSNSTMDYQFTVTLTSPYGDMYNYYMNIVVPLLHLIALAAPRLVSSNSATSPFLVKAYMPGMCTCNMGIISSMSISKNPSGKHVSIHGYPLTVKVTFTIKELYNALAVSPGDNPVAFLYNETLNDYLCNIAGMVPSLELHSKVRANMLQQTKNYFNEWTDVNLYGGVVEGIQDFFNFRP
jgi:hypothetical protein